MRRPLFALLAAVTAVGALAGPAAAQRPKVKIDDARVGLPAGGGSTGDRDLTGRAAPIAKRNTWAPVYVRLEMLGEYKDGGANLKVETTDGDDLKTTLVVPLLPTLADRKPGEKIEPAELPYIPYARVGDRIGEVVLTVLSAPTDGSRPKELSEPYRFTSQGRYVQFKDPANYVVLGLGSRLPAFDLPAEKRETKPGQPNQQPQPGYRDGRVQTAILSDVREMPDQWFGYGAADLVVLGTGAATPEFLDELFDPQKSARFTAQREALFEWVRRGGKLLVSVGANAGKLVQSPVFQDMLPLPLSSEQPSRAVGRPAAAVPGGQRRAGRRQAVNGPAAGRVHGGPVQQNHPPAGPGAAHHRRPGRRAGGDAGALRAGQGDGRRVRPGPLAVRRVPPAGRVLGLAAPRGRHRPHQPAGRG